ncbi:LysR family transcriptional regulator [Tabrizicola sp. TH137]|uniref:LysR family transcriptional regulator n=1 Tax=Tabrizicola sp. TH137 TaxID=2067452 RepID=UPI000C7B1D75|nr:LysR family transcriptional regulator [Tabrizicola sp. TH137]PLL10607.1 LysR family transcriptional regulator [Tabrizicola sp. TH137]
MKLSESHLIQLSAVVDAGSVSKGAAALGLSQPAMSRALAQLEARVGKPLFIRDRRPLQATPLGMQLAAHGRRILAESRRATEAVQSLLRGTRGLVRVGGVPFFMDAMVSRIIANFQNHHPDVMFQQSYGNLSEVALGLQSDQLDLGIVPLGTSGEPEGLEFIPILAARNVACCRQGHPLQRAKRLTTADLGRYPWVAPLPGSPLLADLFAIRSSLGSSDLDIRYSGGSLLSVINYMAETDALAVLPFSVYFAERKQNRIAVLPVDIPQPQRNLGVLRLAGPRGNPAAASFADFVVESFNSMQQLILRHENAVVWRR